MSKFDDFLGRLFGVIEGNDHPTNVSSELKQGIQLSPTPEAALADASLRESQKRGGQTLIDSPLEIVNEEQTESELMDRQVEDFVKKLFGK